MRCHFVILLTSVACATPQIGRGPVPLSPLLVADRVPHFVTLGGIDVALASEPNNAAGLEQIRTGTRVVAVSPVSLEAWTRLEPSSDAHVLARFGYLATLEPGESRRSRAATNARFSIAGRVLGLIVSAFDDPAPDSHAVDLRIEWTLVDVEARTPTFRLVADAHVDGSGPVETTLAAATAATLEQFLGDNTVKLALAPAAPAAVVPWRRTPVGAVGTDTVTITDADLNVDRRGSRLAGAVSAVVSLRGTAGVGSAFMLTRDGLAITNLHVVRNQRSLTARFLDGHHSPVRVLRTDSKADLALLEIACPTDCYTVDLSADLPTVGEDVYAIGSPVSEQYSHTVTKGIVSGVRRKGAERLLQTDAAVNRGNSGGPLIEARTGRVVGIVSEKLELDGIEGMGFAVAVGDALQALRVRHTTP